LNFSQKQIPTMATNSTLATEKCPCCDNPWSRATGDFFAKLCVECDDDKGTNKDKTAPVEFGLSRQNMDLSVSPSDNFFVYANGSWMKNNPIPAGYPNWNTFLALHVQSQERCKALLEELSAQSELSAEEAKVAAFYAAAMDEEAIEQAGIKPMKPLLDAIDQIVTTYQKKDMTEYATLIGKLASTYGTFREHTVHVDYRAARE
jgi:predicted metalloendopeptidase